MTVTNAILLAALIALIVLQWRSYRRYLLVRLEFIQSSDWCARKIEQMADLAIYEIGQLAKQNADTRGYKLSDAEAREYVPDVILEAVEKWCQQRDGFQKRLRAEGIPPLNNDDGLPIELR